MTLTKLVSFNDPTDFEYVNLEMVDWVDVTSTHYEVYMSSGAMLHISLTDTTITALIAAA